MRDIIALKISVLNKTCTSMLVYFLVVSYPMLAIVLVCNNCYLIWYCRECKYNDLLLASSQVDLEDGAKLKRKRKGHVEEKTLKGNVAKDDEGQKSGSNLDSVTEDVDVEDKETQKLVSDK